MRAFFCSYRAAMQNCGVSGGESSSSAAPATKTKEKSKRSRCWLCPRGVDKKAARICASCSHPVCPQHSQLQVVCNDCCQLSTHDSLCLSKPSTLPFFWLLSVFCDFQVSWCKAVVLLNQSSKNRLQTCKSKLYDKRMVHDIIHLLCTAQLCLFQHNMIGVPKDPSRTDKGVKQVGRVRVKG